MVRVVFYPPQRLAIDKNDPHMFASAHKDCNNSKNRYVNVLPCRPPPLLVSGSLPYLPLSPPPPFPLSS